MRLVEEERKAHAGDIAELRALAAEIHHLASEIDEQVVGPELRAKVDRLAEELRVAQPSGLTPIAEDVLVAMIERLRAYGEDAGEKNALREQVENLAQSRTELSQMRTEMHVLRQREEGLLEDKGKLQAQIDEYRRNAERIERNAKAREHQLKATVAALNVTKQLHDDVMRVLHEQIEQAGRKVTEGDKGDKGEKAGARGKTAGGKVAGAKVAANLDAAREELEQARRRMEELHHSYARLEAERETLLKDLAERTGTDVYTRGGTDRIQRAHLQEVAKELEARAAQSAMRAEALETELTTTRGHERALTTTNAGLDAQVRELNGECERLRGEIKRLSSEEALTRARAASELERLRA
jgi:chromosome segregation ATPase